MSGNDLYAIVEKAQSVVWPHVVQLINVNLAKHVNTGDRTQDMIVTAVANGLVLVLASFMYFMSARLWKWYWAAQSVNNDDDNDDMKKPIDAAKVMEKVTIEQIMSYKHVVPLETDFFVDLEWFLCWVEDENVVLSLETKKTTPLYYEYKNSLKICSGYHKFITIPVHQYVENGTKQYIFLHERHLFSQSSTELTKLCDQVKISKNEASKSINSADKIVCNIYSAVQNASSAMLGSIPKNVIFNSLYFDDKPKLLNTISKFQSGTLIPKGLCLPNKIGIVFYGPPGTGKTKCVCALANALRKDVYVVTKRILLDKDLFISTFLARKKTHIFLFDEIDRLLEDVLKAERVPDIPVVTATAINVFGDCDNGRDKKDKKAPVDLCCLLELFDGIYDDDGVVIAATSNDLSLIPPVLLRFGRFHHKLKLGYCSLNMFYDIVSTVIPDIRAKITNEQQIIDLLSRNITPTILINLCIHCDENLDDLLHKMSLLTPKQDYVDYLD